MARAKKETALTPEERLQAALVPDWEWPYKLPGNWCWTNWGECGEFVAGSGFKNEYQGFTNYDIPFYKVSSLKTANETGYLCDNTNTVDETVRKKLKAALIPANSLLFAKIGEAIRLNRRAINTVPCCVDNNMMAFIPIICQLKYAFYWSKGIDLYDFTNATTVPAIRKTDLEKISFPLAPLAEQQRIVDRIESLFAKLDEAKEKAQAVVDSFETRKAAILHKAFTGELTKKWRKSANTRWVYKKIKDCCKLGSGGTPSRKVPDFYKGDIPWIKTGEIEWNDIYDTEEKITQSAIDNSSARCYKPGVVLVAMYGMGVTRGKASILRVQAATNQAVCVLEPQSALLYNRYLLYYFMRNYWDIREKAVGGNQLNLSLTIIKELNIEIPPIDEQVEIVQILDDLFAKEQQTKEAAEVVLDQIDLMKKSILARAFRGELGTNDPIEESALELLKRVLESK